MIDEFKLVPAAASYGSSALAWNLNKMQATLKLVIDSAVRFEALSRSTS